MVVKRRICSLLIAVTVLAGVGAGSCFAESTDRRLTRSDMNIYRPKQSPHYSDGNQIVPGELPWYTVSGSPGKADIEAIGDDERVVCPNEYLADYRVGYVDTGEYGAAFVYIDPGKTKPSNPEKLNHGAKVFVLAEAGPESDKTDFVIFKANNGETSCGWISESWLSKRYPGVTIYIGTPYDGNSKILGEVEAFGSPRFMSRTKCNYLILDRPIANCTGLTLEYALRSGCGEDYSGERDVYIHNGEDWIYIGSFDYESPKSYHVHLQIEEPTDVFAVAVPMKEPKSTAFWLRQNIIYSQAVPEEALKDGGAYDSSFHRGICLGRAVNEFDMQYASGQVKEELYEQFQSAYDTFYQTQSEESFQVLSEILETGLKDEKGLLLKFGQNAEGFMDGFYTGDVSASIYSLYKAGRIPEEIYDEYQKTLNDVFNETTKENFNAFFSYTSNLRDVLIFLAMVLPSETEQ